MLSNMLRGFSSFSRVEGSSIVISSHYPPKLRVPLSDKLQFDFTLMKDESVKEFQDKVTSQCSSYGLRSFKVQSDAMKSQGDETKIEEVLKAKFNIEVNRVNKYYVYPQFETMIDRIDNESSQQIIDKAFEGRSIPISRRVILYHYFDSLLKHLKPSGTISEGQIQSAMEKGLADYSKQFSDLLYKNPMEQIKKAEVELEQLKKQNESIETRAKKHASRMLYLGFATCASQLGGMGYLIFSLYSWEVMEPITYMVSTFYATVGSAFYMYYQRDYEMNSAYEMFKERKLAKLMKKEGFDQKKIQFLEEYIQNLREQIGILQNTNEESTGAF